MILDYQGIYLYKVRIKLRNNQVVTFHNTRFNTKQDEEMYRIAVDLQNREYKQLSYTDLPERL